MKTKLVVLSLVFLGLLFYGLTLRGVYGNIQGKDIKNKLDQRGMPFELSPERNRFILTMSLAENKTFALSKDLADAAYPDVGYYDGRFYIYFAPGISLFALPFYLIGRPFHLSQVGSFAVIPIFATLNLIFLFFVARDIFKLSTRMSLLSSFMFGFASTAWSYAITLYQHQATTFFMISSFYAVWRYKQKRADSWVWGLFVWTNYALAILIDYPNAVLLLPVMVYFALSSISIEKIKNVYKISLRPAVIFTSVLFIMINIGHAYYNYANFGDWKRLSGSLVGYKTILEQKLKTEGQGSEVFKQKEKSKEDVVKFFSEESAPSGFYILLFARDKGLFLFSPIFILGLLGIVKIIKKINLEYAVLLGTVAINFFIYSSFGDPWGGWAFGPRYLIPCMAIFSLFGALWVSGKKWQIGRKILYLVLFVISTAISLLGALTTSAIPPKVEADYLKMKYNFLLNYDVMNANLSSSFAFNQYFTHFMSLWQFYFVILLTLTLIVTLVLFVRPVRLKKS